MSQEALEAENEKLRLENAALRNQLRDYAARYWNLQAEVELAFKTATADNFIARSDESA